MQSQISPSVLAFEKELENILLKFAKRDSSGDGYLVRDDIRKRLNKYNINNYIATIKNFLITVNYYRIFSCYNYTPEVACTLG